MSEAKGGRGKCQTEGVMMSCVHLAHMTQDLKIVVAWYEIIKGWQKGHYVEWTRFSNISISVVTDAELKQLLIN